MLLTLHMTNPCSAKISSFFFLHWFKLVYQKIQTKYIEVCGCNVEKMGESLRCINTDQFTVYQQTFQESPRCQKVFYLNSFYIPSVCFFFLTLIHESNKIVLCGYYYRKHNLKG